MSADQHLNPLQFGDSYHDHGGMRVRLPQDTEDRCSGCGHRLADAVTGTPPVETRYLGPKRWVNELPRRAQARRGGAE